MPPFPCWSTLPAMVTPLAATIILRRLVPRLNRLRMIHAAALIRFGPAPPPRHVAFVRSSLRTRHSGGSAFPRNDALEHRSCRRALKPGSGCPQAVSQLLSRVNVERDATAAFVRSGRPLGSNIGPPNAQVRGADVRPFAPDLHSLSSLCTFTIPTSPSSSDVVVPFGTCWCSCFRTFTRSCFLPCCGSLSLSALLRRAASSVTRGSAGLIRLGCGSSITTLIRRSGSNGRTSATSTRSTTFANCTTRLNHDRRCRSSPGLAARSRADASGGQTVSRVESVSEHQPFSTKSELRLRRTDAAASVRSSLRRQHQNVSAFVCFFPLSRMDVITSPSLLPPPAFVPHSGDDIRYGYAMTTIRCARAIQAHVSAASLPPTPGCPQARFKRQTLRLAGGVAQRAHDFQGGAAPSVASPISHGHPCPMPSAARSIAIQTSFASIKCIGCSSVSPLVRRRYRHRSRLSWCKPFYRWTVG